MGENIGAAARAMWNFGLREMRIVERSILRDLMAEQDLGASGRVDARTAARLGLV